MACFMMEAVVVGEQEEDEVDEEVTTKTILFPQLKCLRLINLQNLMSFCPKSYTLDGSLLETPTVIRCPKMKALSIRFHGTQEVQRSNVDGMQHQLVDQKVTSQSQSTLLRSSSFSTPSKQTENYVESLGEDYTDTSKRDGKEKLQEQLRREAEPGPSYKTEPIFEVPHEFLHEEIELTDVHIRDTPRQTIGVEAETKEVMSYGAIAEPPIIEETNVEVPREPVLDITKYVENCILYCTVLPTDYGFTKDNLIWLWIAQGLIKAEKDERMEDIGSRYFDFLLENECVMPSGFDHFADDVSYKVSDDMTSILEKQSLGPPHGRVVDGGLTDVSILSTHLSVICENFDEKTFDRLKKCQNLLTLLLLRGYGSSVRQVPYDLFLGLNLLLVLDLSGTDISELPSSVGYLKLLRYLDVSQTPIKWLPESIECLDNLQTLRLRDCLGLTGLPKCTNKLINLRHLDLDVAHQLMSMPIGMGNLTSLQTLRAFLVGKEDGCHIGELKNMNSLSGSFCISRLENVLNKEEAREAALGDKQYLKKLELRWGDRRDEKAEDEEEILEWLQPHPGLKELHILFYGGSKLPSCISNPSFASIVSVNLYKCRNCHLLPSIGELPSLKFLNMVEMNNVADINGRFCRNQAGQGHRAFPKLEKLTLDDMVKLKEWTGVENGDFPCLLQLTIKYCPELIALPFLSHVNSLKHLEISYCQKLSSLPEEGVPVSLEFFMVRDCPILQERFYKGEGEDWFKIAHIY